MSAPDDPSPAPARGTQAAPGTGARRAANAFIVLFLAYQVAMPLGYYLSERVYDERFGWRMFSTVRLQKCEIGVEELDAKGSTPRPVVLGRSLHIAWINLLRRGWPSVIEKYLAARCASEQVAEVRLARSCQATDGTTLPIERYALACDGGGLRTGEAAQ